MSKQPSRKGKKAWRKNVDISDVQSGLEQLREEITQGGVIKEKSDEALFAVDLGGDEGIARRVAKELKPLKSDQILAQRSAIPAVSSKKRAPESATTDGVLEQRKRRKDGVSTAQLQRLRAIAYGGASSAPTGVLTHNTKKSVPDYDPWGDDAEDRFKPKLLKELEKLEFVDKPLPILPPKTLKHKPIALAAIGSVPAVRQPHAGISYNPDYDAWDTLIKEEGAKEVEVEKKRLAVEAEAARIAALAEESEKDMLDEDEDESSDEEDEDEDADSDEENKKPVQPQRKTQAQRNKEAKQKKLEQEREEKKKLKQQERELMLVKKYAKDIKKQERERQAALAAKAALPEDDEKNPQIMLKKKLGKIGLPRAPLELQLPDELADSLRTLKPEGNVLSDRFRSLRERGLVEGRTPIIYAKKAKKQTTEKWSYKDFK
ncbi:ribosome biogenesis protein Nop53/GLTSCR2 [Pyronema omphalodes]|nr:ribosome biogenesis protein Nop53/GLTSCR2 [Pyronema omphalodes]